MNINTLKLGAVTIALSAFVFAGCASSMEKSETMDHSKKMHMDKKSKMMHDSKKMHMDKKSKM